MSISALKTHSCYRRYRRQYHTHGLVTAKLQPAFTGLSLVDSLSGVLTRLAGNACCPSCCTCSVKKGTEQAAQAVADTTSNVAGSVRATTSNVAGSVRATASNIASTVSDSVRAAPDTLSQVRLFTQHGVTLQCMSKLKRPVVVSLALISLDR